MLHVQLGALALTLLATMLAAAGCGGSSKTTETTASTTTTTGASTPAVPTTASVPAVTVTVASGKPLSRAQWIAKGDAICVRLSNELEGLSVKKAAELPRVLPLEAAYVRNEVAQLAKLVPPASKASDWQQFLTAGLQWAEGSAKLAEDGKLGDAITKAPLATAVVAIHEHLKQIAKIDGFQHCSST